MWGSSIAVESGATQLRCGRYSAQRRTHVESTLRCVPLCSPECPELALRHAARKAIDAGDVWEAERLIQVCSNVKGCF